MNRLVSTSLVASAVVLAAGLFAGLLLIWTAPETEPEDKVRAAKVVQTIALAPGTQRIAVTAYGTVMPARQVVMQPEVGGRVVRQHSSLVAGGFVRSGEELVGIDPASYELALAERQAALEEALFELELEKGRQVVASREWRLLEQDLIEGEVNRALVLREPHLRRTEAIIRRATNEIAKAKLDLERTSVVAPFNAMVLSESVEIGQLIQPGDPICTLVGTDEFWLQATLPFSQLSRIQLPEPDKSGPNARVFLDVGNGRSSAVWEATVLRLLTDLEPDGRMARIVVGVQDPLGLAAPNKKLPLLLGSYARIEIDAGELHDVLEIPRSALHEGNRIWLVDSNNEVQIREVEILWSRKESVLTANSLQPGEQLIMAGLKTALPGMKVAPVQMGAEVADGNKEGEQP